MLLARTPTPYRTLIKDSIFAKKELSSPEISKCLIKFPKIQLNGKKAPTCKEIIARHEKMSVNCKKINYTLKVLIYTGVI